ncbi:hypothetical protein ACFZAM_22345 [Streptomyces sp. NPDC008079]|uniref:hypothetical protein n=1 Tax=Streptomyces sp. NPDC008079 TaxID=3364806 RepID=UPI0036ED24CB
MPWSRNWAGSAAGGSVRPRADAVAAGRCWTIGWAAAARPGSLAAQADAVRTAMARPPAAYTVCSERSPGVAASSSATRATMASVLSES